MKYKIKECSVKHNTKIKTYRDGNFTKIRCNRKIFKPVGYEKHDDNFNPQKFCYCPMEKKPKSKKKKSCEPRIDSLKRAKDKIFDMVFENDWKYFLTITFNGKDFDRTDPKEVIKKLGKWLNNQVNRKGLKYILVPEYHKNGGIHCHALINDCKLRFVDSGTRIIKGFNKPVSLETIECNNLSLEGAKVVYNVSDWQYGFSTAIETYGEPSQLAFYVTKYITKDVKKIFGKFFWSSKNIKIA